MIAASALGWVATAGFGASYLFRRPATLRIIQAAAACLWILYGVSIGAMPVIVANTVVAGAALYSTFRRTEYDSVGESPRNSGQGSQAI